MLAGGIALVVAVLAQPHLLADDAAITLRYAARLADGRGLTYDDHEAVLGLSTPLWGLLIGAGAAAGLDPVAAARVAAALAFAATVALAVEVARLLSDRVGGALAGALLLLPGAFRGQALSGMEVGLASALGLGAVLATARRRPALAGVLLGLAILTKLDAAALAVGVVAATVLVGGRLRTVLVTAAAVVVPAALLAWWAFATPVPHSLTAKLASPDGTDPMWLLRLLGWPGWLLAALALVGAVQVWRRGDPIGRAVVLGLWLWLALHGLAYSVVDLGAPYPWYAAVLVPPLAAMAAATVGRAVRRRRRDATVGERGLALLTAAAVALVLASGARDLVVDVREDPLPRFQHVLAATREAGTEVAARARPGEVVRTCLGWVGYAALDQPIDDPCGLTTETSPGPVVWLVTDADDLEPGFRTVARFPVACDEGDETALAVAVRRGSAADRRTSASTAPVCR